jgi:hypothetical protein
MQHSVPKLSFILTALAVLMLVCAPPLLAGKQEGNAKNKYAVLVGDYEFDLSDLGMGKIMLNVYVEGESLWAWPDSSSEPTELMVVEGKVFTFYIDDADDGRYDVIFLKDESGKYTKCHVKNEGMGLDSIGTKVGK